MQRSKLELLKEWERVILSSETHLKVLSPLCLEPESPFHLAVGELTDAFTRQVATAVGDKAEWLFWYMYENDMGRKGYEAGMPGAYRQIKTVEDLLWVIT